MAERGWRGARHWKTIANEIAPTLVGGSRKHGGPDLGPCRAKRAWASLGVDALVLGDATPDADFAGMPRLTVQMCAVLQGFPQDWIFSGGKTAAYRQVGNAFPPPVAAALGESIKAAFLASGRVFRAAGAIRRRWGPESAMRGSFLLFQPVKPVRFGAFRKLGQFV